MTERADVAVVGLGVMGANLARNFASRDLRVAGYQRNLEAARTLAARHPEAGLRIAATWSELLADLERPRRLVLLVPAGGPVDSVLDELDPLLEEDDIVVDAGNSHFADTERRLARAADRPWRFVGMGVSGGAEGALLGPAIMPGGDVEAWTRLQPVLELVAAKSEHGPCVAYCGRGSAGHFVKMVHNGIEYGDMQLIAESATLLRRGLGFSGPQVADTFARWNAGELDSYLIEITADIFRTTDPERPDRPDELLVDAILDKAGQKGTGAWTVRAAVELGVAVPTITAAVDARIQSSEKGLRQSAAERFRPAPAPLEGVSVDDVAAALYAAKIASYTQGFRMLTVASEARDYGTDLGEVARIWTAGCIIRARLLARIMEAYRGGAPELLAFAFEDDLKARLPAWRRIVSTATRVGIPVPGLGASLAWFDTLVTARGSANVIQAQRDYFGSHTYERVDRPGEAVHTEWPRFG